MAGARRLYDLTKGTYAITETLRAQIVRQVPFEDLPVCIATLIAATAVFKFQSDYDGDNNRRIELAQALKDVTTVAGAEDIRQRRVNLYQLNPRIQRMPAGSRPLAGSSRISTDGSPKSAWAMPRR